MRLRNGRSGEELSRREKPELPVGRGPIRAQRTKLQSALLSHVNPDTIQLSRKLHRMVDKGSEGVELQFKDGTVVEADLVVGADGIRSVSNGDHIFHLSHKRMTSLVKETHPERLIRQNRSLEILLGQITKSSLREPQYGGHCYHGTT